MNKLAKLILKDIKPIITQVDLSELNGKTVLITGASGLIGNYCLACLKNTGARIVAIVRSNPPDYFEDLIDRNKTKIIKCDLTVKNLTEIPKADYIIHAAGYGQPDRFMENQIKTLQLNTLVIFGLVQRLNKNGKFIFISSSEVYSGLSNSPYNETQVGTTNTTHPRACYIEGKRCGEAIVNTFRQQGINTKSIRLSLAYGPGTKPGDKRVLNSFIQKGLMGSINLLDHGIALRTYCYVSDAVRMLFQVLLFGEDALYNVGGDSRITILQLAKIIGGYLKAPVNVPKQEQKIVGSPDDVRLDMGKMKEEFGKIKYLSFKKGLKQTIEWQKILYEKY